MLTPDKVSGIRLFLSIVALFLESECDATVSVLLKYLKLLPSSWRMMKILVLHGEGEGLKLYLLLCEN